MKWLPDMDLNHDKQIQSLLCYRYTIGQSGGNKLECGKRLSRLGSIGKVGRALRCAPVRNTSMKAGTYGVHALPNPIRGAGFQTCCIAGFQTRQRLAKRVGSPTWKSATQQTWKSALLNADILFRNHSHA